MTLDSQLRQPRSVCVSHEKNGLSGGVSFLICCAFDVLLLTTEQPRIAVTAKPRILSLFCFEGKVSRSILWPTNSFRGGKGRSAYIFQGSISFSSSPDALVQQQVLSSWSWVLEVPGWAVDASRCSHRIPQSFWGQSSGWLRGGLKIEYFEVDCSDISQQKVADEY